MNPRADFARYAESEDGISPYSTPGTSDGEFIATSYEHDIYGKETEDDATKMQMEAKRFRKLETFMEREFGSDFSGFDIVNPEAKRFFITYGVNFFALE